MALALLYPNPGQGKKNDRGKTSAASADVSYRRLAEARQVLRAMPELAPAVRDGAVRLDDALEKVKKQRDEQSSDEARRAVACHLGADSGAG
jgi:hypothetical protein